MKGGSRGIAALVLAAVFILGLTCGVVVEDLLDDMDWPVLGQDNDWEDEAEDDDADEALLEGLSLSREQRAEVERILERREDRLEAYWSRRLPEITALIDSTRAEIRNVLTPDQQAVYDRRLEQLRAEQAREAHD